MRPLFLTLDEVLSLHAEQIRLFGSSPGVRDVGLLESAMGSVEATFDNVFLHETIFAMAAAYISTAFVETTRSSMETSEPLSQQH